MERKNAYLTVEAAMVFPLVLFFLVELMQIAIFQYDRCLMEQNLAVIALRGGDILKDNKAAEDVILIAEQDMYTDQYMGFRQQEFGYEIAGNAITVNKRGKVTFPTFQKHSIQRTYEIQKPKGVEMRRLLRKMKKGDAQ